MSKMIGTRKLHVSRTDVSCAVPGCTHVTRNTVNVLGEPAGICREHRGGRGAINPRSRVLRKSITLIEDARKSEQVAAQAA